jgi:hypothetical protein
MKGIYLTEEGKKEIETEMRELMTDIGHLTTSFLKEFDESCKKVIIEKRIKLNVYNNLLKSATILPVEESWGIVEKQTNMMDEHTLRLIYPSGVIIQPKQ